jgi:hypothetical protein
MDVEFWRQLAERLEGTPRGTRRKIVEETAALLKVSARTLYRKLRAVGDKPAAKESRPIPADKIEKLKIVVGIIHNTTSKKYGPMIPTARAIRLAEQNGMIEPGELSVDLVNRYTRERCPRTSPKALRPPTIPRRPDYVNQVAMFDVSVCAQWYLKPDETIGEQDASIYHTKNKGGRGPVIRRAVYCEVMSHAFWVAYYVGEESMENNLPVLWHAMRPKADPSKYPLRGMPEILIADKGSGLNNSYCKNLFENLGIEFRTHATGHPWAKGSVEQLMFFIERNIESLLRFDPARTIEELNAKIQPILVELNSVNKHSRHKMSRSMAFASEVRKRKEHLIVPPADYNEFTDLAYREDGVKVNAKLAVRFKGATYSFLGDSENCQDPAIQGLRGAEVTVMHSPLDKDRVKIRTADGRLYHVPKVPEDRLGYPSHAVRMKAPQTAPKLAKPAWQENVERAQAAEPPKLEHVFTNDDRLGNIKFIVRPDTEFEPTRAKAIMGIPRLDAKRELQDRLDRKLTRQESAWLNEHWGEMVNDEEIDNVMKMLQPPTDIPDVLHMDEDRRTIASA